MEQKLWNINQIYKEYTLILHKLKWELNTRNLNQKSLIKKWRCLKRNLQQKTYITVKLNYRTTAGKFFVFTQISPHTLCYSIFI